MKFRYTLQKLVDLKTSQKEHAEWELSAAVSKLQVEEHCLTTLVGEQNQVRKQLDEASACKTTISQLQMMQHYVHHLEKQICSQLDQVEGAKQQVARNQKQLTDKMQEEQVWMRAKEKARTQFVAMMHKKEQDELDEIALNRRMQTI